MKLKIFNNYPRLCLFAAKDIDPGEEIRYDYGDENTPWERYYFTFIYYKLNVEGVCI